MKTSTYNLIKHQLSEFHSVVRSVAEYWNNTFPGYTLIDVLLQNMAYSSLKSQEEDEKNMESIIRILKKLRIYNNSYFYTWVYEEVSCIYEGNLMAEDYNEDDFISCPDNQ